MGDAVSARLGCPRAALAAAIIGLLAPRVATASQGVARIALTCQQQRRKASVDPGEVVPLSLQDIFWYLGEIELGTPGQQFRVSFDWRREHSWVPVKAALTDASTHFFYAPEQSSTHADVRQGFSEMRVEGAWARDVLSLGQLRVEKFEFGVATSTGIDGYEDLKYDGSLGLAMRDGGAPSLLELLVEQKQVAEPVFSLFLNRAGRSGELILGGPAPDRFDGELYYTDLAPRSGWTLPLDSVKVGDFKRLAWGTTVAVVPDVVFIAGPKDQVESFFRKWNATKDESFWTIPCGRRGPTLSFRIGGQDYTMTKDDLITAAGDVCFFTVFGLDVEMWYLGSTFFQKFYALFDAGRKRIGLAPARHPTDNLI